MVTKIEKYFSQAILKGWAELLLFFTEEDYLKITGRAGYILPAGSYIVMRLNREGVNPIETQIDIRLHRAIHLIIDSCPDFPSRKQSGILSPGLYKNAMTRMSSDNICEPPMRGRQGKWKTPPAERLAYKENF